MEWAAYLNDDEKLKRSFDNSLCILGAFSDNELVGFIRCVGDGEYFVLVQDLIVLPNYQKQGGTYLFKHVLDKFAGVRMVFVITDIEDEVDNKFYQSFNLEPLANGYMVSYYRLKNHKK